MFDMPTRSPWGEVQHGEELCSGVYMVSTAGHGGIMVRSDLAKSMFSAAARKCAFQQKGFTCFEEDCAAAVAIRELLDKKLMQIPKAYSKEEYTSCIDKTIQRYYPEYWQAHKRAAVKLEKAAAQQRLSGDLGAR